MTSGAITSTPARRPARAALAAALALAFAFAGALVAAEPALAAAPLTAVVTADVAQTSSSGETTVGVPCNTGNLGVACGSAATMQFGRGADDGSGTGVGTSLVSFSAAGKAYRVLPIAGGRSYTEVFRVDNADVTGERESIFLARPTTTSPFTTVTQSDPNGLSMADIFSSNVITRGSDNTFANSAATATNFNNVERISFLRTEPIVTAYPAPVGLTLAERGGNDPVSVARLCSSSTGRATRPHGAPPSGSRRAAGAPSWPTRRRRCSGRIRRMPPTGRPT